MAEKNKMHDDALDKIKRYDENTYMHCIRVGKAACLLGRKLGFPKEECEKLRRAGELHDIGKTKIPLSILNKKGKLTDEEREIINSHVSRGVEILIKKGLTDKYYLDAAGDHHAWYGNDKKGYRVKDGFLPSETAQITAIADVYDALANKRSYKAEKSHDEILEIMDENAEAGQFNRQFYNVFVEKVMPVLEAEKNAIDMEKRLKNIAETVKENRKENTRLNELLCPEKAIGNQEYSFV